MFAAKVFADLNWILSAAMTGTKVRKTVVSDVESNFGAETEAKMDTKIAQKITLKSDKFLVPPLFDFIGKMAPNLAPIFNIKS